MLWGAPQYLDCSHVLNVHTGAATMDPPFCLCVHQGIIHWVASPNDTSNHSLPILVSPCCRLSSRRCNQCSPNQT